MAKVKTTGSDVTLTGFIESFETEDGEFGLTLSTDDRVFIVDTGKNSKRLARLDGEEVEVTGIVTQAKDGTRHIRVEHFELIEATDEDYRADDSRDDYYWSQDY